MIESQDINDGEIIAKTMLESHPTNLALGRYSCDMGLPNGPITSDYGPPDELRKQMLKWVEGVKQAVVNAATAAQEEHEARLKRAAFEKSRLAEPYKVPPMTKEDEIIPGTERGLGLKAVSDLYDRPDPREFVELQIGTVTKALVEARRSAERIPVLQKELTHWESLYTALYGQKNTPDTGGDVEGEEIVAAVKELRSGEYDL